MKRCVSIYSIIFLCCLFQSKASAQSSDRADLAGLIAKQLELAGENREQLQAALDQAAPTEKPAIEFLVAHMPERDMKSLTAEFLLDNVRHALAVRAQTEWQKKVTDDIFFNDVLPYANMDEARDPWRAEFHEKFWPVVKDCQTASEAAQKLNENVFKTLNVRYSTQRKRANQSPKESIEQEIASCSGLAIILVDACRSVGIPARVAGIPKWTNKDGNHTWVEIWDGDWHFTGAAEYDPAGLDRAWFTADAELADKSSLYSSIYAVSFQPTGDFFPMVWARNDRSIHAVNVTERYTKNRKTPDTEKIRVLFRVKDIHTGKRVETGITVWDGENPRDTASTHSRGETKDLNDMLSIELQRDRPYVVMLSEAKPYCRVFTFHTLDEPQQLIDLPFDNGFPPSPFRTPLQWSKGEYESFERETAAYFSSDPDARKSFQFAEKLDGLISQNSLAASDLLHQVYLNSPATQARREDFDKQQVAFNEHRSPYTVKTVGELPVGERKWPLFIAMHGGGNSPPEVNDSQWKVMQRYYKDQPDLGGYKYLALRAPNDTWNGFYDNYVYPLIENLIAQQIAFGDVDPNRVYIMGYSHGGYGAFAIGPKIPDRFAAIHASASAPTDGETTAKTLRTTRFTYMIGEKDDAYGRRERCEAYAKKIAELRGERMDIYPVEMFFKPGYGHGGLPDRDMIRAMLPFVRNPVPREISWELTDSVVDDFFWLSVDKPAKGQSVEARILPGSDNVPKIELATQNMEQLTVWLDERLIGDAGQVDISLNGQTTRHEVTPTLKTLCDSLIRREDPNLAFTWRVNLSIATTAKEETKDRR